MVMLLGVEGDRGEGHWDQYEVPGFALSFKYLKMYVYGILLQNFSVEIIINA